MTDDTTTDRARRWAARYTATGDAFLDEGASHIDGLLGEVALLRAEIVMLRGTLALANRALGNPALLEQP